MIDEQTIRRAAHRHQQQGNLVELSLWFYGRCAGVGLMALAALWLITTHFFLPEGLAGLNYALITTRWTDPLWGIIWRLFDWLLWAMAATLAGQALRQLTRRYLPGSRLATSLLALTYLLTLLAGANVIFTF